MSFEPTPSQALLLFGLLARHGECPQAELMPAVLAKDRQTLVTAKLVAMTKEGRSYQLSLTDAGWGWAGGHLTAELPSAHGTLHDLLARLGDHLARSGETLADFIGSKPENSRPVARRGAAEKKQPIVRKRTKTAARATTPEPAAKRKVAKPKAPTPATLRKSIGEAYLAITGGKKNEAVKLSRLRMELADLDRATVDAALGRILQGDKKASLMRHDDPRQISKADAEAAFSPAGEPFHVLWIAS